MHMPLTIPTAVRVFYNDLEAQRRPHAQRQSVGESFISRQVMLLHDVIGEVLASSPSNLSTEPCGYFRLAHDNILEFLHAGSI